MDSYLDDETADELNTYENFTVNLYQLLQRISFALRPLLRVIRTAVLSVALCVNHFLDFLRWPSVRIICLVMTLLPLPQIFPITNKIASTLTRERHIPLSWCLTPVFGNLCPIATIPQEINEAHDEIADILRSMNHLVPLGYRACLVKRELQVLGSFVRIHTERLSFNRLFITLKKYGIAEHLSKLRSLGKEAEHDLATACLHFEIHMRTMERSIMSYSEKINDLQNAIEAYKATETVFAYWCEKGWTRAEILDDLKARFLTGGGENALTLWNEGYHDRVERPLDFHREILDGYFLTTQNSYVLRAAYESHFDLLDNWVRLMITSTEALLLYNIPKKETLRPTMELFELAQDIRRALLAKAMEKNMWTRITYHLSGTLPYDVQLALNDLDRIRPVSYEPLEIQTELINITSRFKSMKEVLSRIQNRLGEWAESQDPVVGSNAQHLAQLHKEIREIRDDLRRRLALGPKKAGDDGLERWRLIEAGRSQSQ